MEAREIRYLEIQDKHGENGEFVFSLNIPIVASWEMAHAATANFCKAISELEERQKTAQQPPAVEEAPVVE